MASDVRLITYFSCLGFNIWGKPEADQCFFLAATALKWLINQTLFKKKKKQKKCISMYIHTSPAKGIYAHMLHQGCMCSVSRWLFELLLLSIISNQSAHSDLTSSDMMTPV